MCVFVYICLFVIANGKQSLLFIIVDGGERCPGWCKAPCINAKVSVSERMQVNGRNSVTNHSS